MLRKLSVDRKYLILIDGLDEFADGHCQQSHLTRAVREIASTGHNVKVCCSSRPEPMFKITFASCPTLRLEDFNQDDIDVYC